MNRSENEGWEKSFHGPIRSMHDGTIIPEEALGKEDSASEKEGQKKEKAEKDDMISKRVRSCQEGLSMSQKFYARWRLAFSGE